MDMRSVFWTVKDIQNVFGFQKTSAYSMVKTDGFPRPYVFPTKGDGSRKRWRADEVLEWAETCKAREV